MAFDESRLKELIVYIAKKSGDDPSFGKTKLIKLLAWSDFLAYARLGRSLTGADYIKLDYGPAPKQFPPALNLLRALGRVREVGEDAFTYTQDRVIAVDEPDLSNYTPEEIALVDEVVHHFREWSNTALSEESHREFVGWRLAGDREPIRFASVFLSPEGLTDEDVMRGREIAAEMGLASA
jgi:hypothetical protein